MAKIATYLDTLPAPTLSSAPNPAMDYLELYRATEGVAEQILKGQSIIGLTEHVVPNSETAYFAAIGRISRSYTLETQPQGINLSIEAVLLQPVNLQANGVWRSGLNNRAFETPPSVQYQSDVLQICQICNGLADGYVKKVLSFAKELKRQQEYLAEEREPEIGRVIKLKAVRRVVSEP